MGQTEILTFPEPIRSRDSTTFNGTFQTLGTPLQFPSVLIKFVNNSNVNVFISWDGENDHDFIPAGSFSLYDINTNRSSPSGGLYIQAGTQFYTFGVGGGGNAGSVYLISLHQGF